MNFTENMLEEACIDILKERGYEHHFSPERSDYKEVILVDRVKDALFKHKSSCVSRAVFSK